MKTLPLPLINIAIGILLVIISILFTDYKNNYIEKVIVNTFKDRICSENIEFYLVSKTGSKLYTNDISEGIYNSTNIGDCIDSKLDSYNECSIIIRKYYNREIIDYYKYYFVFDNKTIEIPKYEYDTRKIGDKFSITHSIYFGINIFCYMLGFSGIFLISRTIWKELK